VSFDCSVLGSEDTTVTSGDLPSGGWGMNKVHVEPARNVRSTMMRRIMLSGLGIETLTNTRYVSH
jgi:hypothetical protein